jgi:hypothetical protein
MDPESDFFTPNPGSKLNADLGAILMGGGGAQVVRNATAGEAGPCPASVAALIRYLAMKEQNS